MLYCTITWMERKCQSQNFPLTPGCWLMMLAISPFPSIKSNPPLSIPFGLRLPHLQPRSSESTNSVLASRSLAGFLFHYSLRVSDQSFCKKKEQKMKGKTYQLLQIPPADGHVAAVLVHALGELLGRALAVVPPRAAAVACLGRGLGLGGLGRLAGSAAAEDAADAVADDVPDRGADGDTAVEGPTVTLAFLLLEIFSSTANWATGTEKVERGGGREKDVRSGAGHLPEEAGALRGGRSLGGCDGRSGRRGRGRVGRRRPGLLLLGGRGRGAGGDGRAGRGPGGRS